MRLKTSPLSSGESIQKVVSHNQNQGSWGISSRVGFAWLSDLNRERFIFVLQRNSWIKLQSKSSSIQMAVTNKRVQIVSFAFSLAEVLFCPRGKLRPVDGKTNIEPIYYTGPQNEVSSFHLFVFKRMP